jgi:hypothetical protein
MKRIDYYVCQSWAATMLPLAEFERERDAIHRLRNWEGKEEDVRTCAALLSRNGRGPEAEELLKTIPSSQAERTTS